jgi:hypothetical protein
MTTTEEIRPVDADGAVTSDAEEVAQITTFEPVQENDAEPDGETRVEDEPADEAKDAKSRARGPRPPRHQRRDLGRAGERRRFTTTIEWRSVEEDGDEAVLEGMPIVYETPYSVRDCLGTFRETMKPGVAAATMRSRDFDCKFLENHTGRPFATVGNGTLTFEDTPEGLRSFARMDLRRTDARDLALTVERRDVTQMSCGFVVNDDAWRWGDDGIEERDIFSFDDLFDVSAVTYPASPTTSIAVAQRALMAAFPGDVESRERLRRLWYIAKDIRSGKVLSQQNGQELMDALEALHNADDVDIPGIVKQLEDIDAAVDTAQGALSNVLDRANPDGDADDQEPALVPASDTDRSADIADLIARQRQKLRLLDVA